MEFRTQINGIPCICRVTHYSPATPMARNGYGEVIDPPEPEEFDFEILDRKGYRAYWLERKVDEHIEFRLCHEYKKIVSEFNASMALDN